MSKEENARAKRAKILFFIVKYANLWGFCCRRCRGCLSSLLRSFRQQQQQGNATSEEFDWQSEEILEQFLAVLLKKKNKTHITSFMVSGEKLSNILIQFKQLRIF